MGGDVRYGRAWALGLMLLVGIVVACTRDSFACESDAACRLGMDSGVCIEPGYCAFEDETCPSGLAFGEFAAPQVAGTCVPVDGTSGPGGSTGTSEGPDASTGAASTADGADSSAETATPTCITGTVCTPDDRCATEGVCSDEGVCEPTSFLACDDPPGPCFETTGTCDEQGRCQYEFLEPGAPCDDDNPCTLDDACDDGGQCQPGPECPPAPGCQTYHCESSGCVPDEVCPNDDPCLVVECVEERCEVSAVADGTACGPNAADRCCGGQCVDISSDTDHCGGCNTPCFEGLECESVAVTDTCESSPAQTSARCRCQTANAQCPLGQLCRTVSPYVDRCVPETSANCDGIRIGVNFCPSYCSY